MKRASTTISRIKKPRLQVPEYHLTPSVHDESGEIIWPAPRDQIERARNFILDWFAPMMQNSNASANKEDQANVSDQCRREEEDADRA